MPLTLVHISFLPLSLSLSRSVCLSLQEHEWRRLPPLDFATNRDEWMSPEELAAWSATGWRDVFHHAYNRTEPLRYSLYEDAQHYDALSAAVDIPILILQGRRDTVVKPQSSMTYAASHPNVTLRMLDDDHRLQDHLDEIWTESAVFLGLDR